MAELLRRFVWIAFVCAAIAYGSYLALGSAVEAEASGANVPVLIRDKVAPGEHHLSGMLMVSSVCDELSVRTEYIDKATYALRFKTWRDPAVECEGGQTPRAFNAVLFAPAAGVQFIATLDDRSFPIAVLPTVD